MWAQTTATSTASGRNRARLLSDAGLALAAIIWGGNFVVIKVALGVMPPMYYLGVRFLLSFLLLLPFALPRLRRLSRRDWGTSAGVGALLFLGFWFQTVGLVHTSPGISGFLTSLYVVLVPLMLGLWHRHWPSPLVGTGVVVVFAGMAVLSVTGPLIFAYGEVLTLIATIFWALHILAVAYAAPRVDAISLTAVQMAVTGILAFVTSFVSETLPGFPGWGGVAAIGYTAVMGGVVAYLLMMVGQQRTPATEAGVLLSLECVFALVFSIVFGFDHLGPRALAGFGLVFLGIALTQIGSARAGEAVPPEGTAGADLVRRAQP